MERCHARISSVHFTEMSSALDAGTSGEMEGKWVPTSGSATKESRERTETAR